MFSAASTASVHPLGGEQRGALGREAGRRERSWDAAVSSHLPCEGEPIWRY